MACSTYPITTIDVTYFVANDGQRFEDERKCRQHNARLSIKEIIDEGWPTEAGRSDAFDFILENLCALAPFLDDLNG